ncbi:pilus assembly protein TadG-related protein [Rhizobium sp. A22-96]
MKKLFEWVALWRDRRGNVAITTALVSPLILYCLGLGIDYGMMTLQQQRLQQLSDIGAITAASNITSANSTLLANLQSNGTTAALATGSNYLTSNGPITSAAANSGQYETLANMVLGTYKADTSIAPANRFSSGSTPADSVKVTLTQKALMPFSSAFADAPTLSATGTATSERLAAFSVGSRLASLDGGILNQLLGTLLGTKISLKLVDYQSLIGAKINLLSFLNLLATDLNLTALSYNDLLATDVTYDKILGALGKSTNLSPAVVTIINNLGKSLGKTKVTLKLQDLLNLGPDGKNIVGTGPNLSVNMSVMNFLSLTAMAANQQRQISIDLGAALPGLLTATMTLAVGEIAQQTPSLAVGAPGATVRTPQVRVMVDVAVTGLSIIAGLKLRIPLYIELAPAEAKLASITCVGGNMPNAVVGIDAVPGVAEIALGDVDPTAFVNFGTKPRVTQAAIIDSLLLRVLASAQIDIANMTPTRVTFQPSEISNGTIKTVSTRDVVTSLISSLLKNTNVTIQILIITIGTPSGILSALADTLSVITAPVDQLLYNLLGLLGIGVGQADIQVTDARCLQPVLVQ